MLATLTYRRPESLARLLPELAKQAEQVQELGWNVGILVVDNDPEGSGRATVDDFCRASAATGKCPDIRYELERTVGISAARNRALDRACAADLLAFIDDDELPFDQWLPTLIATQQQYSSAAVVGLVVPDYETPPDPWILAGGFFERQRRPTGTVMAAGFAGNLLLDMRAVRELDLRFDDGFGLSGGEDTLFTMRLVAAGQQIVWCDEARVVDFVPSTRLTRRWVLIRRFSAANTAVLCKLALGRTRTTRTLTRAASIGGGAARLGLGLCRYLAGIVVGSLEHQAKGLRLAARGTGLIAGAFGYRYLEYRRA